MERGTGGGQQQQQEQQQHQQQQYHYQQQQQQQKQQPHHQLVVSVHSYDPYMTMSTAGANEELTAGQSSFDNPATKKKPPKLKSISRSLSMAIDNYAPPDIGDNSDDGAPHMLMDDGLIVEQPLVHRSASPVAIRSVPPPQTLALPAQHQYHAHHGVGGGGSGAVSPALSARQQLHQHQMHLHTFQRLAAQAANPRHHQHSSLASSPTSHTVSPVLGSTGSSSSHQQHEQPLQPDIYLVSSSSLGDDVGVGAGLGRAMLGGSTSPIQFIDDMLQPSTSSALRGHIGTHPLKKTLFRRSDTIDVHPSANFQMKKTHSFHTQQDPTAMELLAAQAGTGAGTSRRTSSVRANFLVPGPAGSKEISRSPSPSRRGCRSHRSFNDPARRPSTKPESIVDSQIRHPSLNDDLIESMETARPSSLYPQAKLSLENELFMESRSRSNSHTMMDAVDRDLAATQRIRKTSGSFEDSAVPGSGHGASTHPPASSSSLKQKREHQHARQQSSHSLEFDGRPAAQSTHKKHLHSAAAAATAAYHFKRGAQQGRSLYLSPNNLEELTIHRPGVIAAAAAFQGTNASAQVKQAKALHSASMRLRTYRETLSASKKSKSFIGDGTYPPTAAALASDSGNLEFELTSPHRRNSRPLSTAVPGASTSSAAALDEIKRSPRPLTSTSAAAAAAAAFLEEKRPSFERKPSLTYELSDTEFAAQVLRPFHHKLAGRKASMSGSHKALKKKSLSDETDEDEESERKRKRIVCIVMTVFLCLVCASVFVIILTLTHQSGQSTHHTHHNLHQQTGKKVHVYSRDTPVHYTVRQENERLLKETMDRSRFSKNFTEAAPLAALQQQHHQQQHQTQQQQLQQQHIP